ncbi:MAG TPA: DUF814 domain-containing protein, partial [Helicobacteraceae bacterium]|nr:DUF814 domain-containing protein [Helicobacteraceae bacterium]
MKNSFFQNPSVLSHSLLFFNFGIIATFERCYNHIYKSRTIGVNVKFSHLEQIVAHFKDLRKINAIYRVADTIIKIVFNDEKTLYFDMRKSNSQIFMCEDYPRTKIYQAPFDVMLSKYINRASITDISLVEGDKILRITTALSSAYKQAKTVLQFEFTGKYTNAILLDENEVVIEALRHVDAGSSFRVIKAGYELLTPPPPPFEPKPFPLEDVEAFLYEVYAKQERSKLAQFKKQKLGLLHKKQEKLRQRLEGLSDEAVLESEVETLQHYGNLMLSNMHLITPYATVQKIKDYDGSDIEVYVAPNLQTGAQMSEYLFKMAKKNKQRVRHLHIERASLQEKIQHLDYFINIVEGSQSLSKLQLLFPSRAQQGKKSQKDEGFETFWYEGYKIMLGKSEKGNIALLENARAKDIWLHMKDRPSAHVIIVTDKQNVPKNV